METNPTPASGARTGLLWSALVAALVLALGAGAWKWLSGREHADTGAAGSGIGAASALVLASFGEPLPDFALTERSGRTVTLGDLKGRVWVADFIFTRCPNVCPDLTRRMGAIRKRLDEAGATSVVSVSISVDPKHDTPKILADYATTFHAAPSWLFLTGEPRAVYGLVNRGFRLAMADPDQGAPGHSNRFVLVDAQGRIRGTRTGTEDGAVDGIVQDALALTRETRG